MFLHFFWLSNGWGTSYPTSYLLIQDMGWILVMAKHESLNSTRGVRGRKTCAHTHGLVVDQWMTQWLGFICRHRIKRFPWSRWRRLTIESKTEFKGNFIFWMARHCVLCLPWTNMFGKREWIYTLTLTTLYCNTFKFFHCGIWPPLYAMFSLILALYSLGRRNLRAKYCHLYLFSALLYSFWVAWIDEFFTLYLFKT